MFSTILIILAYLIGSVPSAIIVCKAMGLTDPRSDGSKNPGTSNVLRMHGRKAAAITLAGDIMKGLIPVLIARVFNFHPLVTGIVAIAVVIGHAYPIFYKFKGGKGVATTVGVLFALSFYTGIMVCVTWIVVLFISRYASLASLVAAGAMPIYILLFANAAYFIPVLLIAILIFWVHSENIQRLKSKSETKIKW